MDPQKESFIGQPDPSHCMFVFDLTKETSFDQALGQREEEFIRRAEKMVLVDRKGDSERLPEFIWKKKCREVGSSEELYFTLG